MSDTAVSPAVNEDEAALATPFVKCLVRLIRAQDASGSGRQMGRHVAGRLHRHQKTAPWDACHRRSRS